MTQTCDFVGMSCRLLSDGDRLQASDPGGARRARWLAYCLIADRSVLDDPASDPHFAWFEQRTRRCQAA